MRTLAEELGAAPHISALLQKAKRLRLLPEGLQQLAVQRGCVHYSTGKALSPLSVSEAQFSNEELALALLSVALPYDPWSIRCGAAMLGAQGNSPARLARLAVLERSVVPVRYVAEAGKKYEPENVFWKELLNELPSSPRAKAGVLPHPTRFVAMTGFTRKGPGLVVEWLRPQRRALAA